LIPEILGGKIFEMKILQGRKTKADALFTQPASWPGTRFGDDRKKTTAKATSCGKNKKLRRAQLRSPNLLVLF
jgi:hypothetical protein